MESSAAALRVNDKIYVYLAEDDGKGTKKVKADVIKVKQGKQQGLKVKLQLKDGSLMKANLDDLEWKFIKKRSFEQTEADNAYDGEVSRRFKPDLYKSIIPIKMYERRQRFVSRFPVESLRNILAPMVGASELPFRLLCRQYGATLAYTPMILSDKFAVDAAYRTEEFQSCAADRPLVAHFAANDPEVLLAAARHVEHQCDAIDLNLGCPQRVAYVGKFGSFLLDAAHRSLVLRIVNTLHTQLSVPVFVKIRLLDDLEDTYTLVRELYEAGADVVAIHARYRVNLTDRSGPTARDGPAHLDQLAAVCRRFPHIPIITNGNVRVHEDLQANLQQTDAYGIMVAESILDNPAIFSPTAVSKLALAQQYLTLCQKYPAKLKSVVFHTRRTLKEQLVQFQCLEEVCRATSMDEVVGVVRRVEEYLQDAGKFVFDEAKARREKELAKIRKEEEGRRKRYEERMMRKAKREGKPQDFYILLAAEQRPTQQILARLKSLPHDEAFAEWKARHAQHCWAFHMQQGGCARDRTCAFLHMECLCAGAEQSGEDAEEGGEIFG